MNRMVSMALVAASVALPAAADTMTSTTTTDVSEAAPHKHVRSLGLMADVGVNDYNRDIQHEVDAGASYGVRADFSPQRNIGLELGYQGGVNSLDSNVSSDGRLITNQVGGDIRANLVPATRDLPANLKPFVFGGAAYHRIDTDNFTPGFQDDTNAFALPVGAGVEAEFGDRFLVGGRFTYNFLFHEQDGFGGKDGDMWAATVNLGTRLSRGF